MSDRIDIRVEERDHHHDSSHAILHELAHIRHLLEVQTKLLHQILAREPNWYPAPVGGSITVR